MAADTDTCKVCGSTNLFSGFFDAEGFAVPVNVGAVTPAGVKWTAICNDCGHMQSKRKPKSHN